MRKKRVVSGFLMLAILLFIAGLFISSSRDLLGNHYVYPLNSNKLIKVMTFNIRGGRDNDRHVQLATLIKEIRQNDPDVIGLQEVDIRLPRSGFQNEIEYISSELKMNYIFVPTINFIIGSYGDAILSKFPIESYKGYRLPSGLEPRGIIEATIKYQEQEVSVYSTHFGLDNHERESQFNTLKDIIKQNTTAKIILGDLNTRPTELKLKDLKAEMVDSYHPSQKSIVSIPIEKTQLDYVLYSRQFKQLDLYAGHSQVSDHNPVVCTLALN